MEKDSRDKHRVMNQPLNEPPSAGARSDGIERASEFAAFGKRLALVVGVVLALLLVGAAAEIFLLLFAGILFAIFLKSLSDWLADHTPLSPRWSLLVVALALLALLALLAGVVALAVPRVTEQVKELRQTLPQSVEKLRTRVERYPWGAAVVEATQRPASYLPNTETLVKRGLGLFSTTFGALAALLVVVFVGICLAIEPRTYTRGLLALVPVRRRERGRQVLIDVQERLASWQLAKTASMAVVGVLTGLGLWMLGVPLVFTLALLAALLTFIPNIGPILAAAPAVLLALMESPAKALYVILLYVGVQAVETYAITPFIERKAVSLPPVLTAFTQLLFGLLTGVPGLILATPLTAAGLVLVQKLYVEDTLGDRGSEGNQPDPTPRAHGATGRVNPWKPPFAVFRAYQSHEISRMAA